MPQYYTFHLFLVVLCRLSQSTHLLFILSHFAFSCHASFSFFVWFQSLARSFFSFFLFHPSLTPIFLLFSSLKCQLSKIYVTCIIAVKWVFFSFILPHIGAFDLFPTIQICNGNRCLSFLHINIFGTYYMENEELDSNNVMESNPINWASSYRVKCLSDCCHRNDLGQKITIQHLTT